MGDERPGYAEPGDKKQKLMETKRVELKPGDRCPKCKKGKVVLEEKSYTQAPSQTPYGSRAYEPHKYTEPKCDACGASGFGLYSESRGSGADKKYFYRRQAPINPKYVPLIERDNKLVEDKWARREPCSSARRSGCSSAGPWSKGLRNTLGEAIMANREEIRKKIEARRAQKQAASKAKFAKMRKAAEANPGEIEKDLTLLADACAAQAEAFENLKENLDLIQAPKEASLAVRAKAARNYARAFVRIAEESPEKLQGAISEAYHSLDEQAGALEQLAEHLGIDLNATPAEEAFAEEGVQEIDKADEAGFPLSEEVKEDAGEVEKEAAGSGSDAWVTDRGADGEPKAPERVEGPRVAAGSGNDAFVTDRDKDSKPRAPKKMDIPQAKGESEVNKASSKGPARGTTASGRV